MCEDGKLSIKAEKTNLPGRRRNRSDTKTERKTYYNEEKGCLIAGIR